MTHHFAIPNLLKTALVELNQTDGLERVKEIELSYPLA